jgi:hypothetical protein
VLGCSPENHRFIPESYTESNRFPMSPRRSDHPRWYQFPHEPAFYSARAATKGINTLPVHIPPLHFIPVARFTARFNSATVSRRR